MSDSHLKRPNVILIQADQMATEPLRFYNKNGNAITPNLSKLASEGVLFKNCYCSSPLCSPSRASMFSGSRTSKNEVWGNGSEFHSDIPTLMHYLKNIGYRNVVSGKTHFIGADQLHGFDKRLTTDIYPSNFAWSIDWKPHVEHREGTSVKKLDVSGVCKINGQILYDTEVQFRAIEFLRYEAIEPKKSPFFLHISYTQPHEPYQTTKEFWDLYENTEFKLPDEISSNEEKHPVTKWLDVHHGINLYPPSEKTILASKRAYCAMITNVDHYIGEILAELKNLDLSDDTIIIFTSDHGDMFGNRGMWFKRTFYEQSIKVPLIIHNPMKYHPKVVKENVSLIDLMATIVEIASDGDDFELVNNQDSNSFAAILDSDSYDWKDQAIVEYFGPGVEEPWLAIIKGSWKYIYTHNNKPLLFNLEEDPKETINLSDKKDFIEIQEKLHYELLDKLDIDVLVERAIKSKKVRVFLHKILDGSEGYNWSYQPFFNAKEQYVRGPNLPFWK